MVNWKKNLIIVWLAQFLSIMGFSFALPFAPFFIQELGVTDPEKLKFWVAMFGASAALSLAIFSPIWGAMSDRFGRKPMLIRAYFGGAVVLSLMGTVHSVVYLVILRLLQGMLTGTITASQTLISAGTPEHRTGFAMGSLSAAVFSGTMTGSAIGGAVAEYFGYRAAFIISGGILFVAAMLVSFGVQEEFSRPKLPSLRVNFRPGLAKVAIVMPILVLFVAMAFARQFDGSFLPLLVQEIHGTLEGASLYTGILNAIGGIAGLLAGVCLGWLADRINPSKIGRWSALGAGLLMIPQGLAHSLLLLFTARFGMVFFSGGLDPVFLIWLAKVTPHKSKGFIFGWAATAKSIGWILAPLVSGFFAAQFGVRSIYFIGAAFLFMLIPLIWYVIEIIGIKKIED